MELYERLACLMPTPETMHEWKLPTKKSIMDCITEKYAHLNFTDWAERIGKFMIKFRRQIKVLQKNKKMYVDRELVPRQIEEAITLACKCIGWKLQFKKKTVAIFPHMPNIQKEKRRMVLEYNYQQALKKVLV